MDEHDGTDSTPYDMASYPAQQHTQLFGAYGEDPSSPMLTGLGVHAAGYYADDIDGSRADTDAKRRRITRACDMCRKKKIKCDGKQPKCGHCTNYKTNCVFTLVEKKRNPPKGAKYIQGLENRLGRMESLLKMSGLLTEEEAGRTDLGTLEKRLADKASSNSHRQPSSSRQSPNGLSNTPPLPGPRETLRQEARDSPQDSATSVDSPATDKRSEQVENLSDLMCSLVTNNVGETRYIGSSSAFSIFSRKGIEWVNSKTGDTSFQDTIQDAVNDEDIKWMYWKPEIFGDIFVRRIFRPLPPKEEALALFQDYFENFNCMFPLFHEPTFMHLVEKQYSPDPYEGSGWWASINVALAIAYRIRVMSNVVPAEDDQKAWFYLKNAMGVLTELTLRNTDLLSVQALLGMALFLQGTPHPQPSFFLISAAIRQSHSIGLHKRGAAFNLNPIEAEQRKRVFWIAYMLDKDTCLRSGRPPAQEDDDMNVELPSEDPPDNIGNIPLSDGKGKVNLFRLMCEFAMISSKVYRKLYSVSASRQSDGELLNTIGELDSELEAWKDKIPIDFRPEHEIKACHPPLILHIVVLHFSYYNCLTTIHRMSVHHGYWTSRLSDYAIQGLNARPLNPRVYSSAALCVAAARASINLIKYIPQGDFACVWLIIYFPVSALVTLFANILQNPQDTRARADIKLMDLVVNFLANVVTDEGSGSLNRMHSICTEFARIARVALDKAEKEASKRKRRLTTDEILPQGQPAMSLALAQAQAMSGRRPTTPPRTHGAAATNAASTSPRTAGIAAATNLGQPRARSSSGALPFAQHDLPPPTTTEAAATTAAAPAADGSQNAFKANQAFMGASTFSGPELSDFLPPSPDGSPDAPNQQQQQQQQSPLEAPSFQHPFVPQDLWQMPMTLEWDWAGLTGGPFHDFLDDGSNMPPPSL